MKNIHKIIFVIVLAMVFIVPSYSVHADDDGIGIDYEKFVKDFKETGDVDEEYLQKYGDALKKVFKGDYSVNVNDIEKAITALDQFENNTWFFKVCVKEALTLFKEDKLKKGNKEEEIKKSFSCEYIFGAPSDEASPANMIQKILNYMKILAPLLVILLSGFDFAKNALAGDQDEMKKATKKLGIRLLCAVGVYLAPLLAGFLINFINESSVDPTCNIK